MSFLRGFFILFYLFFFFQIVGFSQISDPDFSQYSQLLIGKWKLVDIEHTTEMENTQACFKEDCTYTMSIPCDLVQVEDTIHITHQYLLKADSLIVTGPDDYRRVIYKILKLNDEELVLKFKEKAYYKRIN